MSLRGRRLGRAGPGGSVICDDEVLDFELEVVVELGILYGLFS